MLKDLVESYQWERVYAVGDVVTKNLLTYGVIPTSVAVDEKTRRGVQVEQLALYYKVVRVHNPPGYITDEAWRAVEEAVKTRLVIKVEGEEDMLSLAFIKLAPPHSVVVYGHYLGAMIVIPVDWYREDIAKLFEYLEKC
jgi:Uncharacterized protein conserved in archaea